MTAPDDEADAAASKRPPRHRDAVRSTVRWSRAADMMPRCGTAARARRACAAASAMSCLRHALLLERGELLAKLVELRLEVARAAAFSLGIRQACRRPRPGTICLVSSMLPDRQQLVVVRRCGTAPSRARPAGACLLAPRPACRSDRSHQEVGELGLGRLARGPCATPSGRTGSAARSRSRLICSALSGVVVSRRVEVLGVVGGDVDLLVGDRQGVGLVVGGANGLEAVLRVDAVRAEA